MSDRSVFDALEHDLTPTGATGQSLFPLRECIESLEKQSEKRRATLDSLGANSLSPEVFAAIGVADAVSAAARAGIRHAGAQASHVPIEALVDLYGYAQATRALWFDLFLGVKRVTEGAERVQLLQSARELVAEAARCAVKLSAESSQLVEYSKISGLS